MDVTSSDVAPSEEIVETAIRAIIPKLVKPVGVRAQNALNHFDKSLEILSIDREMASFRAITGEEEAATALMKAIQLRDYPNWRRLNSRLHTHKAATLVSMDAVRTSIARGISNFTLDIDTKKCRIDVKVSLDEFGIKMPEGRNFALSPTEPLDIIISRSATENQPEREDFFEKELQKIALDANFKSPSEMVKFIANQRNILLYASDSKLPSSKATRSAILLRKNRSMTLIVIAVMILQTRKHQGLVTQSIQAILTMVDNLPKNSEN